MYELLATIYDSQGDRNQAATLREQAKRVAPKPAPVPAQ
jgi:hypothetical protein